MKTNLILAFLFVLFVSCEKDYDLIAEYCTYENPATCPLSDGGNVQVEQNSKFQDGKKLELLDVFYSGDKGNIVFNFEFTHEIDTDSLFYAGTELDNIIILDKDGQKRMASVEVNKYKLIVKPAIDLLGSNYSVTLKADIKDIRGHSLGSTITIHPK